MVKLYEHLKSRSILGVCELAGSKLGSLIVLKSVIAVPITPTRSVELTVGAMSKTESKAVVTVLSWSSSVSVMLIVNRSAGVLAGVSSKYRCVSRLNVVVPAGSVRV